ncbi:MAG: hypothetical protein FD164_1382 [Nitrospirae bacterium]|nr:MAG: hypothetical protein FD164_1382 [Nitrospirota bacterium]
MMRRIRLIIVALLFVSGVCSCATIAERQQKEYGLLMSAVSFSAGKVFGEYGDDIPEKFDAAWLLSVVKDKMPADYFNALRRYRLDVAAQGTYYRLLVFRGKELILFDFSCTEQVDGPVLLRPQAYDLSMLDQYDSCRLPVQYPP